MHDFNITRAARAVVRVTDLNTARNFYVNGLGFIETESDENHIYLRGLEERGHHSYVLKKAEQPGVEVISYKVEQDRDLDSLAALFEGKGMKLKWFAKGSQQALGRAFRVQDISGIPVEFFCSMDTVERLLQRYDLYRGARMQRIDHFNCMVPDVQNAYDFYRNELGYACSEYTMTKNNDIWAAWLHRKPAVHDIAFMNGKGPRLHHVGFWLSDPMSVIHTCDVLASLGYAKSIERGPGRHGLSNAFFLYLRDPDGNRIELYTGDYFTGDADFEPIRWDLDDPQRATFWGHEPPDSWFNEAMPFVDFNTGKPVVVQEAKLEQRKPDFIV
ncbi:3,4-dihydroxyphenylacetate 2,3-dioxygenase [Virgibacillus profundi]|uniref:3,4-dihydroxyphenylacetate 2,3-dioxygenase n=1 Tax=Virgibacillus profundi TaxID=2024555 RepID=A0A2A2IB88_9BACI|nr:3,4-dihydroxyphenylacetate 2,3-dioxygenase [Virgibacillus profundi]PAV28887.1 3,4-dihydroxyphenylacetate 2,3-dioxygenase [Virgibacillus profundi]PXY53055.1 3,4-dihydroxyphenylacetate 2,3-dioxygenase [Virgibacillus profundi]